MPDHHSQRGDTPHVPNLSKLARTLLRQFCRDDSEFQKFMFDNFKSTFDRMSLTMDRVAKENKLFEHEDIGSIVAAIKADYPDAASYEKKLWQDSAPKAQTFKSGPIWFSQDLGKGFVFRNGPLVLTYLAPSARLSVLVGPPWESIDEVVELRGAQFKGQFFVDADWSISANSETCVCSGYYPYDGLPVADGDHHLSNGALFYKKFGKQSLIILPIEGALDLEERKRQAISEVRILLQREFPEPTWENGSLDTKPPKKLLAYLDIV